MRYLLLNRHNVHMGGDMIQLQGYQKALQKLGHTADYSYDLDPDLSNYDMAWLHHLNWKWSWPHYLACKKQNKPFCIVSIFYPEFHGISKPNMLKMMNDATMIFCLSERIRQEMISFFNLTDELLEKICIVPNGIDQDIFHTEGVRIGRPGFVFSCGRFEEYKGHHRIIEACKLVDLPVVAVGPFSHPNYVERCRKIWSETEIYDGVSQTDLAKWYRAAKVYVLASLTERFGLGIIESVACGSRAVSTIHSRGNEWFTDVPHVDPEDIEALAQAIKGEWDKHPQKTEMDVWTWDRVTQMMLRSIDERNK